MRAVVAIEVVALLLACALGWGLNHPWWNSMAFGPVVLAGAAAGLGTTIASMYPILWLRRHGHPNAGAFVDKYFVAIAENLGSADILFVAAASGFAEEALFRGVLLPLMGLIGSSVLFGLLHMGVRDLTVNGIWAAVMSAVLGVLYLQSGTLWCPIFCHAVHNGVMLWYLRGPYRGVARGGM